MEEIKTMKDQSQSHKQDIIYYDYARLTQIKTKKKGQSMTLRAKLTLSSL